MNYRLLYREEIDVARWNKAVTLSASPCLYALAWYLDAVSPDWEALVLGEYDAVFPLPVKRRLFFRYVVQPKFAQQLGLFASTPVSEKEMEEAFRSIPYSYTRLQLNRSNLWPDVQKDNIILDLSSSYTDLRSNYSRNQLKNLRQALREEVSVSLIEDDHWFVSRLCLFNLHFAQSESLIRTILTAARRYARVEVLRTDLPEESSELAGACFVTACGRSYYLFSYSTPKGRSCSAMYALIDRFVKDHAGENLLLDFEGSSIPSIRYFFEGFGGVEEHYSLYHREPCWMRFFR